jgi:hypothetical protein
MIVAKHAPPVPLAGRWEMCPRCKQVRAVGAKWKRACLPEKRASRYVGN